MDDTRRRVRESESVNTDGIVRPIRVPMVLASVFRRSSASSLCLSQSVVYPFARSLYLRSKNLTIVVVRSTVRFIVLTFIHTLINIRAANCIFLRMVVRRPHTYITIQSPRVNAATVTSWRFADYLLQTQHQTKSAPVLGTRMTSVAT